MDSHAVHNGRVRAFHRRTEERVELRTRSHQRGSDECGGREDREAVVLAPYGRGEGGRPREEVRVGGHPRHVAAIEGDPGVRRARLCRCRRGGVPKARDLPSKDGLVGNEGVSDGEYVRVTEALRQSESVRREAVVPV